MATSKAIMTISDEQQAQLKGKGAEVLVHPLTGDMLAAKPPTRDQWKQFRRAAASEQDDTRDLAPEQLVYDCAVFPDRAALSSYFDARPAAAQSFATAIARLGGLGGVAEKKE